MLLTLSCRVENVQIYYYTNNIRRVGSSWSTRGTRRVPLVTNPVISDELGKCLRQVEHIRGYF
jgi:hypothetical protein